MLESTRESVLSNQTLYFISPFQLNICIAYPKIQVKSLKKKQ